MRSRGTETFWRLYRGLPKTVRGQAVRTFRLWLDDPRHPSVRFKKIHAEQPIYSARISRGYRALCLVEKDLALWFWIGSHDDYERLIDGL